jgi:hypothetical protein
MTFKNIFKKLSFTTVAGYVLLFALTAKIVYMYATHHPSKEDLFFVKGVVHKVHLGGQGTLTYFIVESNGQVNRYSSYYGKVWPGMENIVKGDIVSILAEKK